MRLLLVAALLGALLLALAPTASAVVLAAGPSSPPTPGELPFLTDLVEAFAVAAAHPPVLDPEPFVLTWPAEGQVTDGFGPRWGRMHTGVDIGILRRLVVIAAADGRVEATGYLPGYEGYGNVVLLAHGHGQETLYAHLSRVRARVGQHVKAGTWIGVAGCTGSCTGTHLHFELREHGTPVDPMPFLPS
jgi:murein DD-endopeptidase MepM/ murein hydrolase activator NlpD